MADLTPWLHIFKLMAISVNRDADGHNIFVLLNVQLPPLILTRQW